MCDIPLLTFVVIGAMMIPLAMRVGFTTVGHEQGDDKNSQKYDIFGLSSVICQLDKNIYFCRQNIV